MGRNPDYRADEEVRAVLWRLRRARERAGLSIRRAAQLLGVTHPTLSAIEQGHRSLTVVDVCVLSGCYGVPAAAILTGEPFGVQGVTQRLEDT